MDILEVTKIEEKKSDKINIVISGDKKVYLAICALINSIYYNTKKEEEIQIFLIVESLEIRKDLVNVCQIKTELNDMLDIERDDGGIKIIIPPKELINKLRENVENYIFYSVKGQVDYGKNKPNNIFNIIRFYFPKLLPKMVDKIVYLDSDMIVQGDVAELFNILPEKEIIGAVYQKYPYELLTRKWILSKKLIGGLGQILFNGGMYVTYMKKWVENNYTELCMKILMMNTKKTCFFLGQTQPVMNIVFKRVFRIGNNWNQTGLGESGCFLNNYYNTREDVKSAIPESDILHWTGHCKPWLYKINSKEYRIYNCHLWTKYYYLHKNLNNLMGSFIKTLLKGKEEEIKELEIFLKKFPLKKCSVRIDDILFIYLMIRYFKPKHILEIGTRTGRNLTTMMRGCIKNSSPYTIHSIDVDNECIIEKERLKNVKMYKGDVDKILKQAIGKVNFIFCSKKITSKTSKILNRIMTPSTILCTMDFMAPISTGALNMYNIIKNTCLNENVLVNPSHKCNRKYKESLKNTEVLDEISKKYLKLHPEVLGNLEENHVGINNSVSILLPRKYQEFTDFGFVENSLNTIITIKEVDYSRPILRTFSEDDDIFIISSVVDGLPKLEFYGEKIKDKKSKEIMKEMKETIRDNFIKKRRWNLRR